MLIFPCATMKMGIHHHLISFFDLVFPTRCGQRPEFLTSRMFCSGHPPVWYAVLECPFGRNSSISLLVCLLGFFPSLPCQQFHSLRCSLPFSACVHTRVVSNHWNSLLCYTLLAPSWCLHSLYRLPEFTLSTFNGHYSILLSLRDQVTIHIYADHCFAHGIQITCYSEY